MLKNTQEKYGLISRLLHWLSAIAVFSLFALGYWMVDLTYYSEWYQTAPHWHESFGILLLLATLFRLGWRFFSTVPSAIAEHSSFVKTGAHLTHIVIYILLLSLMVSGYLISSADERAISVFDWFDVISLGEFIENQGDIAGTIHEYIAYSLVILSLLHGLAALKHHFIDKDKTLLRMLK